MAVRTFSKLDAVATSLDAFAAETTSQADLSNSQIASQRDPKDSPFAPQADMNDSPIESRSQRSVNDPAILLLADLNESGIALQWFEAIAIVQELCRSLSDSRADSRGTALNGSHVAIDRAGSVFLVGEECNGSANVRQVGELLSGLLKDDIPVPLRLALSQSVSSPPFYVSIAAFSQALEYFERPNRIGLIQAVHSRWEARPRENRTPFPIAVQPPEQPAAEAPRVQHTRAKLPRWFVTTSIVLGTISVLTMIVALILPRRSEPSGAQPPANPIVAAGNSVAKTASSIAAAVINKFGAAPDPPAPSPTETVKSSDPAAKASGRRVVRSPVTPVPSVPVSPPVAGPTLEPTLTLQGFSAAEPSNPAFNADNSASGGQIALGNIYSDGDADVEPPVTVYPQMPSASFGPPEENAAIFDIVIDQAGKVESVKLRHKPTSMGNAMVMTMGLSVAKAWRFRPALRQGQPVKYRKTIWMPAS